MTKFTLAILCCILLGFNSQGQTFDTPVSYMDFMGNQYEQLKKDLWDYQKAAAHSKRAKKIDKRRQELIVTTKSIKEKIAQMPDYKGNIAYRDATVAYLDMRYNTLVEDYAKIVDLEAIAEQSYDGMEAYLLAKEEVSKKLSEAHKKLSKAQKTFAEANNINLIEGEDDKITKKLDQAGKVYEYYNDIYLIFYKSHIQADYLIKAQNKQDMNAMEQNKNSLAKYSKEGLAQLGKMKTFNKDATLKNACREMLLFYQKQARQAEAVVNFYLTKETFEKVKTSFEAIKKSKRTQADVDKYNSALKKYNEAIPAFNKANAEMDKNRGKALDKWNKISSKFIDTHVP